MWPASRAADRQGLVGRARFITTILDGLIFNAFTPRFQATGWRERGASTSRRTRRRGADAGRPCLSPPPPRPPRNAVAIDPHHSPVVRHVWRGINLSNVQEAEAVGEIRAVNVDRGFIYIKPTGEAQRKENLRFAGHDAPLDGDSARLCRRYGPANVANSTPLMSSDPLFSRPGDNRSDGLQDERAELKRAPTYPWSLLGFGSKRRGWPGLRLRPCRSTRE